MSNYTQFRDTQFFVTPEGQVFSHYPANRNSAPRPRLVGKGKSCGYHVVKPKSQGGWYVHQMVMECYGPPQPEGDYVIDHKDENKENNHVDNLQWLPRGDNVRKSLASC